LYNLQANALQSPGLIKGDEFGLLSRQSVICLRRIKVPG